MDMIIINYTFLGIFPDLTEVRWRKKGLQKSIQSVFCGENHDKLLEFTEHISGREYRETRQYRHRNGMQVNHMRPIH